MSLDEFDQITPYELYLRLERYYINNRIRIAQNNQIATIAAIAKAGLLRQHADPKDFGFIELRNRKQTISEVKRAHLIELGKKRREKLKNRGRWQQ